MDKNESLGFLLRYILYHVKSIEERLKWSKAINNFRQEDKQTINRAIVKMTGAVNDLISIVNKVNPDLARQIKKEVEQPDLADFMALTEQLFDLNAETLGEITDLIDNYLKEKHDRLEKQKEALNDQC